MHHEYKILVTQIQENKYKSIFLFNLFLEKLRSYLKHFIQPKLYMEETNSFSNSEHFAPMDGPDNVRKIQSSEINFKMSSIVDFYLRWKLGKFEVGSNPSRENFWYSYCGFIAQSNYTMYNELGFLIWLNILKVKVILNHNYNSLNIYCETRTQIPWNLCQVTPVIYLFCQFIWNQFKFNCFLYKFCYKN